MAWVSQVTRYTQSAGPDGRSVWYAVKEFLKTAGWTVVKSSDGVLTFGAGDNITVDATGAGGVQNSGAWMVLREPGGRRELRWSTNASAQWLIVYSTTDKFTTPGTLTVAPTTPADGQFVWDNVGTPIWAFWNPAPLAVVMTASDTAHNGAYPFHIHINYRAGHRNTAIGMGVMKEGTEQYGDTDPVVFYGTTSSGMWSGTTINNGRCWIHYPDAAWRQWVICDTNSWNMTNQNPGGNGGEGWDADGTHVVMAPVHAFAGASSDAGGRILKGIFWDIREPMNRAVVWPGLVGDGTADQWMPGATDNSASSAVQSMCVPWTGTRPRI